MKSLWHSLMHAFGWYSGRVVSRWRGGELYIGFRCSNCGKVGGIVKMDTSDLPHHSSDTTWTQ